MRAWLCLAFGAVAEVAALQAGQVLPAGQALTRALSTARPLIVHVADDCPAELNALDVDDMSRGCRMAGASALLVQPELLAAVAKEQATAAGDFPGPLPLLYECDLAAASEFDFESVRQLGACAVGMRCEASSAATGSLDILLREAVAGAEAAGLGALVLAGDAAAYAAAVNAGVGMVVISGAVGEEGAAEEGAAEGASTLEVGLWDGDDGQLQRLRAAGFAALLLDDPCRGDVAGGLR